MLTEAAMSVKPRRRVDLLQSEFDHGRLSQLALAAGRGIEAALESVTRSTGSAWRPRVDSSPRPDEGLHAIEAARRGRLAMARVEAAVGPVDARIVRQVLGDRLSFADVAERDGRVGRRAVSSVAKRFRSTLERLAMAETATGEVRVLSHDKYSAAAKAIERRIQ